MSRPVLPDAYVEILDGALGLTSDFPSGVFAQIGSASNGPLNSPVVVTDPDAARKGFGGGELTKALVLAFMAGARMIVAVRAKQSIPGSIGDISRRSPGAIGPVTKTGQGSGTVQVTGTPTQTGLLEMQIVDGGEVGTATFKWRLNDGEWSEPLTMQGRVPIQSLGISLWWQGGTQPSFVSGDSFSCQIASQGFGAMTATGAPSRDCSVTVKITATGGVGSAKFIYKIDEQPWSAEHTAQSSFNLEDTGIVLGFSDGDPPGYSFLKDEEFSFEAEGAHSSVDDVMEAVSALEKVQYPIEFVHIVGPTSASLWAALQAKADELEQNHRYLHFLCEARGPSDEETVDEWVTNLLLEAGAVSGKRLAICAGRVYADGYGLGRNGVNAAALYAGRLSRLKVHQSPGRVIDGPLPFATQVAPIDESGNSLVNDGHIALLDGTGKFVTFRKFIGLSGVYVTNGRMKVDDTSDFRWVEWRRTMDKACREVRLAALRSVHKDATKEGLKALEADCQHVLNLMKAAGEVTDAKAIIPDGQDVLATSTVKVKVRIQPVATMRWIELEMAFENPFKQQS
jgi:hypothetical protein